IWLPTLPILGAILAGFVPCFLFFREKPHPKAAVTAAPPPKAEAGEITVAPAPLPSSQPLPIATVFAEEVTTETTAPPPEAKEPEVKPAEAKKTAAKKTAAKQVPPKKTTAKKAPAKKAAKK